MTKNLSLLVTTLACVVAAFASAPATAQTCGPLDNGRLADVRFEGTVIQFDPVVDFREMVLTIGGPCEDIIRVFGPKDPISFDIREIERVTDGQYTWQLKRVSNIDPGVQKELQGARGTGEEDDLWWSFFQKGAIPEGPYTDSGSFTVDRGLIVDPGSGEEKSASLSRRSAGSRSAEAMLAGALGSDEPSGGSGGNTLAPKDTVLTNSDGVIRNSLCVGFDCLNNNTYSDTTIMLTENNTRIKFDDTSTLNSFPRNDWEIEANSNLNGGQSFLGFNDCGQSSGGGCATDLVFAVEAGVRQNALYVESDGDVGLGTSNPVVRLHVIDGDTPALRLEQDGSSGFEPQVWDLAGNETNFFVRDATNGSTLPFRIQPGTASSTLFLANDEQVGIGTSSPDAKLDVDGGSADTEFRVTGNSAGTIFRLTTTANNAFFGTDTNDVMAFITDSTERMRLTTAGNLGLGCQNPGSDLVVGSAASCGTAPASSMNAGDSGFTVTSSRTLKKNLSPVQVSDILDKIGEVGVYEYDFIAGPEDKIGLMAEDFHRVFGRGSDKLLNGQEVQMALWLAVQELSAQNRALAAEIERLKTER